MWPPTGNRSDRNSFARGEFSAKEPVVKFQTVAFASFAALFAFGCANGKTNFFTGDGGLEGGTVSKDGGGKEDGGTSGTSDCASFCSGAADTGVGCDDTAKCTSTCKTDTKTASNAGCTDERDALLECASSGKKGVLVTCSSTKITISGCSSQQTALEDCIANSGNTTVPTKDAGTNPGSCTLQQQIFTTTACNTCAEQNCCNEWNACLASSDCIALVNCLTGCAAGNTTCENTCASNNPSGVTPYNTAISCMQTPCASACQ